MFKKRYHEVLFTLMTSGLMIYIMAVYNTALHLGGLEYDCFAIALRSFPLEWAVGFILALFVAGKAAPKLAFRVAQPGDRPIFIILCIQSFTVCCMVLMMSLLGTLENSGISLELPIVWLQTVALNFIAALPLQIFIVGPLCRAVFRRAFGAFTM